MAIQSVSWGLFLSASRRFLSIDSWKRGVTDLMCTRPPMIGHSLWPTYMTHRTDLNHIGAADKVMNGEGGRQVRPIISPPGSYISDHQDKYVDI